MTRWPNIEKYSNGVTPFEGTQSLGEGLDVSVDEWAASSEDIPGLSSKYEDVTSTGSRITNVETDVTPERFAENLKDSGWKESSSKDGEATIFTKDGAKYSLYPKSASTGGPSAEYTPAGAAKSTLKIRFGK